MRGGSRTGKTIARCPSHPAGECIASFGFPCTVFYEPTPRSSRVRGATTKYFWELNDPADLEAFGANAHRHRHVSSPLFRAACLAEVS